MASAGNQRKSRTDEHDSPIHHVGLLIAAPVTIAAAEQPNVLIIAADDMNWDSVGCYGCPLKGVTPSIDKLARQGSGFTMLMQRRRPVFLHGVPSVRVGEAIAAAEDVSG